MIIIIIQSNHLPSDTLSIIEQIESLLPPILILDLSHLPRVSIVKNDVYLGSSTETDPEETL